MFEQENLQGWNISHIVSSWHYGLGKESAAAAPSLVFKFPWRKKTVLKTGRGLRGERRILGVGCLPSQGERDLVTIQSTDHAGNDALICLMWKTFGGTRGGGK